MRLPPHSPVLVRPGANGGLDVQIGLTSPLVLSGLAFDERTFLSSIEGGAAVAPERARRFTRVVSRLAAAGAWEERPIPLRSPARVAVHGAGQLGMEAAAMLAAAGLDVTMCDDAPVSTEPPGTFTSPAVSTCAGAAAATLGSRGVRVYVGDSGNGSAALEVVICTGAADPILITRYTRTDIPHILAVCDGESVWVSHVIVPGLTPCSRCRDIALTRADPAWPRLALQLGGGQAASRRPAAPRLAGPVAAACIAAGAVGWLERADTGAGRLVTGDGQEELREVAAEPDCGCGAAGPVGDELAAWRARWR